MHAVNCPVIDLRREPKEATQDFSHDDNRETQLIYAEPVKVLQAGEWSFIYAPLQNYKGWVKARELVALNRPYRPNHVVCTANARLKKQGLHLSFGTLLEVNLAGRVILPDGSEDTLKELRPLQMNMHSLKSDAAYFLGFNYLWGGCSAPLPHQISSVDCSGLVHLLFRAQGICLPRDAKDQACRGYRVKHCQPGDALYLYREGKKPHHVVLAIDEQTCIESPKTGEKVRLLEWGKTIAWQGPLLWIEGREPTYCVVKRFCSRPRSLSRAFV